MKDYGTDRDLFPSFASAATYLHYLNDSRCLFPAHHVGGWKGMAQSPAELVHRVKQLRAINFQPLDQREHAILAYADALEAETAKESQP